MDKDEIRRTLQSVFQDVFDSESFVFADELSREDLKSWDSLGHIRLISTAEEAFSVQFTLDEIAELTTAGLFVECLARKL
jgi:acyl carrier protein